MARVYTCLDAANPDGSYPVPCVNAVFEVQVTPGPWPGLSLEQGIEIGQAWMLALVAVAVIRIFLSPKLHR